MTHFSTASFADAKLRIGGVFGAIEKNGWHEKRAPLAVDDDRGLSVMNLSTVTGDAI